MQNFSKYENYCNFFTNAFKDISSIIAGLNYKYYSDAETYAQELKYGLAQINSILNDAGDIDGRLKPVIENWTKNAITELNQLPLTDQALHSFYVEYLIKGTLGYSSDSKFIEEFLKENPRFSKEYFKEDYSDFYKKFSESVSGQNDMAAINRPGNSAIELFQAIRMNLRLNEKLCNDMPQINCVSDEQHQLRLIGDSAHKNTVARQIYDSLHNFYEYGNADRRPLEIDVIAVNDNEANCLINNGSGRSSVIHTFVLDNLSCVEYIVPKPCDLEMANRFQEANRELAFMFREEPHANGIDSIKRLFGELRYGNPEEIGLVVAQIAHNIPDTYNNHNYEYIPQILDKMQDKQLYLHPDKDAIDLEYSN